MWRRGRNQWGEGSLSCVGLLAPQSSREAGEGVAGLRGALFTDTCYPTLPSAQEHRRDTESHLRKRCMLGDGAQEARSQRGGLHFPKFHSPSPSGNQLRESQSLRELTRKESFYWCTQNCQIPTQTRRSPRLHQKSSLLSPLQR